MTLKTLLAALLVVVAGTTALADEPFCTNPRETFPESPFRLEVSVVLQLLVALLVLLAGLPFYWAYRLLLRLAIEIVWVTRGRRILLVYSRSPVWQEYIETKWLPKLQDHALVLNWSDRATWKRRKSLAVWVFRHWAPPNNFNPMAIVFPPFRGVRRIRFYHAFRDWKHGKGRDLTDLESQLFAYVDGPPSPST